MIQVARPPLQSGPSVFWGRYKHIDWACGAICQHTHTHTHTLRPHYCVTQVSSRDISVGLWPGYGIDHRGIVFDSKQGQGIFPSPKDQTVSGTHPASYAIGTPGSCFDCKARRTWSASLAFICYMIWYICYRQLGWHPVAVVQYTFTHKQYIEQHKQYIEQHN